MTKTTKAQVEATKEKAEVVTPKKDVTKKGATKEKVAKVEKKEKEVKTEKVETKVETKKEVANKKKRDVQPTVPQMTNEELKALMVECGAKATGGAKSDSVVYNQFGTKSRILQQKKGYQLLLVNGHKKEKENIVASDIDDVKRFQEWYNTLTDEQKKWVNPELTKLSDSEMPREKACKLLSKDMLVSFIKYMSGFAENAVEVAK